MGGHKGPQRQSWSSIQLWKSFVKRMTIRVFGILAILHQPHQHHQKKQWSLQTEAMSPQTAWPCPQCLWPRPQAKEKKSVDRCTAVVSSVVSGNWAECGNNWTKDLPCCLLEISAPLFEQCYAFLPCRNISRNHREKKHQQSTNYRYHNLHLKHPMALFEQ